MAAGWCGVVCRRAEVAEALRIKISGWLAICSCSLELLLVPAPRRAISVSLAERVLRVRVLVLEGGPEAAGVGTAEDG